MQKKLALKGTQQIQIHQYWPHARSEVIVHVNNIYSCILPVVLKFDDLTDGMQTMSKNIANPNRVLTGVLATYSSFQQGDHTVYHALTNEHTSFSYCSIRLCVCVTFLPFGWEREISTVKMQSYTHCTAAALENTCILSYTTLLRRILNNYSMSVRWI